MQLMQAGYLSLVSKTILLIDVKRQIYACRQSSSHVRRRCCFKVADQSEELWSP